MNSGEKLLEYFCINNQNNQLETIKIIEQICKKIYSILDFSTQNELLDLASKIHFLTFGLDKFINNPPRSAKISGFRDGPMVVIKNTDGKIFFINDSFIKNSGLKDNEDFFSKDKIIQVIEEKEKFTETENISKFYKIVYSQETQNRIFVRENNLNNSTHYVDVFENHLSGDSILWRTYKTGNIIIQSGFNIKTINHILINRILKEQENLRISGIKLGDGLSYSLEENIKKFSIKIESILDQNNPEYKNISELLKILLIFGKIGDVLIDKSYFLVRGFDGESHYFNSEFLRNTSFENAQNLLLSLKDGTFLRKVYGEDVNYTKKQLSSLNEKGHYCDYFYPIVNEKGKREMISWDTFKYEKPQFLGKTDKSLIKTFGIGALENCDDI